MDKKRRDNRKLDTAGQALVRDDSHTLREQGRAFSPTCWAAIPAPTRTGNGPSRTPTIYNGPPAAYGGRFFDGRPLA